MRIRNKELCSSELDQMWDRWRSGQSFTEIATALERSYAVVWSRLVRTGGYAPCKRRPNPCHLSAPEREEISRGLVRGYSVRAIAQHLGRSPSTVSREISRNGSISSYRATAAQTRAHEQAKRPKRCKLVASKRLQVAVAKGLSHDWSPEQISGWLRREFSSDAGMQISHETIYRTLFVQARGALKAELRDHLRSQQRMRVGRANRAKKASRIADAVSIRERPAEVEDRAVPGHWEGDLLMGGPSSCIITLVERKTRYVMLAKVPSKASEDVVPVLTKLIQTLPEQLRGSVTWDRGFELRKHKEFTVATDVTVYFCDPHSPQQRGTNENTNGLLRQYFPKGDDVSKYTQAQLDAVAKRLNQRPRKTLDFSTPAQALTRALQ